MAILTLSCAVDDCDISPIKKGLCNKHYLRLWRYGDPTAGGTGNGEADKFIRSMLNATPTDDCIILPFGRKGNGYGKIYVNGKMIGAHRYVCELVHGAPDKGMIALHSCGKGHLGCVNHKHLRWGTYSDNYQDSVAHGTASIGAKCRSTKLTEDQVKEIIAIKGKGSQKSIAERFGVAQSVISRIQSGKNWRHVQ